MAKRGMILVLEDSDEDFDTIKEAVRHAKLAIELKRVTTGDACLELLRVSKSRALRPDIVLLDLNTPGLDGRDTLCEIRADARLAPLPLVVLSSSANPRDIDACYRAGANTYHVKPTRYADCRDLVVKILEYWLVHAVLPDRNTLS